jgi:hypothetical protein
VVTGTRGRSAVWSASAHPVTISLSYASLKRCNNMVDEIFDGGRPIRVYVGTLKIVSVTKAVVAAGDYAAEDVLSESATNGAGTAWTFTEIARGNSGTGYITRAQVICETTGQTPRLTMYLFKALPTSELDDNAANTALLHADLANYVGKIDFPALEDLGGDSEAVATPSTTGNLPLAFKCADTADDLYGILVTRDAITGEAAGDDYTVRLTAEVY